MCVNNALICFFEILYFYNLKESMFDQQEILKILLPLLEIDSVKSAPAVDAPFGKGVKKALDYVLSLAKEMGFKTINYDNYVGEVIYGEGKPFGVLCHLDVVPTGSLSAWKYPPFCPTIEGDRLYCRGAVDDKSAAISVLFALFEMKKRGIVPKRQIKLILGCDEESGWGCIEHYKKCACLPEDGFSPDADFPVIYAEKGILHVKYAFKMLKPFFAQGGVKANVVCDHATADADIDGNGVKTYEFFGKTAHGSTPEKGENALLKMTAFLEEHGFLESGVTDKLFLNCEGAKKLRDETGCLTFSPNIAATKGNEIYYTVDVRYPATMERSFIEEKLSLIGKYSVLSFQPPLFSDKNGRLVKTLVGVFNEVTGKNAEPIAIGGGTYARALKNGVAFGPCINEEGDTVHMPNEYITLSTLMKMTEIYYKALIKLCVVNTYNNL